MSTEKQKSRSPALRCGRFVRRVGRYVCLLRKSQGFTGPELARLAGIGKGHLSKIENHGENMSLSTVVKLAKALQVPPAFLVSKGEAPNK